MRGAFSMSLNLLSLPFSFEMYPHVSVYGALRLLLQQISHKDIHYNVE